MDCRGHAMRGCSLHSVRMDITQTDSWLDSLANHGAEASQEFMRSPKERADLIRKLRWLADRLETPDPGQAVAK